MVFPDVRAGYFVTSTRLPGTPEARKSAFAWGPGSERWARLPIHFWTCLKQTALNRAMSSREVYSGAAPLQRSSGS
jgi:hypothetical protein